MLLLLVLLAVVVILGMLLAAFISQQRKTILLLIKKYPHPNVETECPQDNKRYTKIAVTMQTTIRQVQSPCEYHNNIEELSTVRLTEEYFNEAMFADTDHETYHCNTSWPDIFDQRSNSEFPNETVPFQPCGFIIPVQETVKHSPTPSLVTHCVMDYMYRQSNDNVHLAC